MKENAKLFIIFMAIALIVSSCTTLRKNIHENENCADRLIGHITQSSPQIIGFGEYHPPEGYQGRTSLEYFSKEILPCLSFLGYRDLVIEFLFEGSAEPELEINENIQLKNKEDMKMMLLACRMLGVTVHGSMPWDVTVLDTNQDGYRKNYSNAININANLRDIAERLNSDGKKVIVYSGNLHNDCLARDLNLRGFLSYGVGFFKRFNHKYLEVQLIAQGLEKWIKKVCDPEIDPVQKYLDDSIGPNKRLLAISNKRQNTIVLIHK